MGEEHEVWESFTPNSQNLCPDDCQQGVAEHVCARERLGRLLEKILSDVN